MHPLRQDLYWIGFAIAMFSPVYVPSMLVAAALAIRGPKRGWPVAVAAANALPFALGFIAVGLFGDLQVSEGDLLFQLASQSVIVMLIVLATGPIVTIAAVVAWLRRRRLATRSP